MIDRPTLSAALRVTARRIADGARYEWGHVGRCNCGHLVQTLTGMTDRQIYATFRLELTEWSEHARGRCDATGSDVEELFAYLSQAGITREDVLHLEQLSDTRVLARVPRACRPIQRSRREHVVAYLRAMAQCVDEGLLGGGPQTGPDPAREGSPRDPARPGIA